MPAHNRKLKFLTLTIDGVEHQCQVQQWTVENNSDDGERLYSFCGPPEEDGEFRDEAEDEYALAVTFYSDWRSGGISDVLWENDQQTVPFILDHHPDIPAEHVRWAGSVKLKAPNVGGEARTTEMTEVTMQIIGKPTYTRVGA